MINIAICDDNINICSEIENILLEYKNENNVKFNIDIFNSGNKFLEYLTLGYTYDILFLDIQIGDLTGVDVGDFIRNKLKDRYIKIVYVSNFEKYAMKLFDLKPTNFLIKPLDKNKLKKVLNDMLYDLKIQSEEFIFSFKNVIFKIKYKDIIYFEKIKLSKNIKLITTNNEYIFRDSLNKIQEILKSNDFIKINKSILVNFNHIKIFSPNKFKIILTNEEELPLSKNRIREIKETYFNLLDERYY